MCKCIIANSVSVFLIMCILALFNACEHEIEYREVIKEVPVEVIVEVPYEVPIEVPVEDETRINELNTQIYELRSSYDLQLSLLNETHNAKLEELNNLNADNEAFLLEIEALKEENQQQIEALNETYQTQISDLQTQLSSATITETELNVQFAELKLTHEAELIQVNEAYRAKVAELSKSSANNETLLLEIETLKAENEQQIEALNETYNTQINDLQEQLSSTTITETRFNELSAQFAELKLTHEAELLQVNEAYRAKAAELQTSNSGKVILLRKIEDLETAYQNQLEALNDSYNAEITALQNQLSQSTHFEVYELRVYKLNDPERGYDRIINQEQARNWYTSYVANHVPEQCVFYREDSLRRAVNDSVYITASADTIIRDVGANKLAYDSYWQDGNFIFWFVKPLW